MEKKADENLVVFLLTILVTFILVVGNKAYLYGILFYPFLMLMIAEAMTDLLHSFKNSPTHRHTYTFMLILLVVFIGTKVWSLGSTYSDFQDYDYYAMTDKIRDVIPSDARIVSVPTWWLGLSDYDYQSSWNLSFYNFYQDYSLEEGLAKLRPDYIIVAGLLRHWQTDSKTFETGPGWTMYHIPRQPFSQFLAEKGEKVLDFHDPWHGRFEVYAINWE